MTNKSRSLIKSVRKDLGISPNELAAWLGMTLHGLRSLEHGETSHRITLAELAEVAQALNLKLIYGFAPADMSKQLGHRTQVVELDSTHDRRMQRLGIKRADPSHSDLLLRSPFELNCGTFDPTNREATIFGKRVRLTLKEFAALETLARFYPDVAPYAAMFKAGWPDTPSITIFALSDLMSRLRRKLNESPTDPTIRSQRREGYLLVPPSNHGLEPH